MHCVGAECPTANLPRSGIMTARPPRHNQLSCVSLSHAQTAYIRWASDYHASKNNVSRLESLGSGVEPAFGSHEREPRQHDGG